MKMKMKAVLTACMGATTTLLLIAVGCKVGPNYQNPNMQVPAHFGETTTRPTSRPAVDITCWWEAFDDPILNSIIDDSVQSNLDLKLATAKLRQVRAQRGVVAADWWPTVDVDGSYTRQRRTGAASGTITQPGDNGVVIGNGGDRYSSLWEGGFDATWFRRLCLVLNASKANGDIQAAVEDRRDTLVTLLSEVAVAYIDLRGNQRDLIITENNMKSQQQTLNLTQERFRAGIASDLDVAQAEAQVATTASAVPTLEAEIRQGIHSLSVLTGKDPDALSAELTPPRDLIFQLPAVPLGLPSELLRRRPDIRRSERQLAAQTARVGVAVADLFPKFSLTGSYSWQAKQKSHICSPMPKAACWPEHHWPIWDAGQIRANIAVEDAIQEQTLDTYQQTVLSAMQDVEDKLVAYDREQVRRVYLAQSVASNRRAVDLSNQLYLYGLVDFTVLDSERSLFTAEVLLVKSDISVSEDLIALFKALGGGWDRAPEPSDSTTQPIADAKQ